MPSSFLTSDVDQMLADPFFSSAVVMGAQNTRGILDVTEVVEKDHSSFDVFVRKRTCLIRTGSLTGLLAGATLTIDGVTYTLHDWQKREDDAVTELIVAP